MFVKLDDDLVARYQAQDPTKPVEQLIGAQLMRFAPFPSTVRIVPLAREPLQQVEALLGGGQITSGAALVDRIKGYASAYLGKIEIPLSAAQKEEIAHRAQKQGKSPDQVVQEMVAVLIDQMFDAVTPYR